MKQERDYGLDLLRILTPWMVFYVLACIAGIFLVCCAVEWCRKALCIRIGITSGISRLSDRIQNKICKILARYFQ